MQEPTEYTMIGGLWEAEDRRGNSYLKGTITIAARVFNISAYPPRDSSSDNAPAYVLRCPALQLEELEALIAEWRAQLAQQHPF